MLIVGCDLNTRYREIAVLDTGTGEVLRHRLEQENGELVATVSVFLTVGFGCHQPR